MTGPGTSHVVSAGGSRGAAGDALVLPAPARPASTIPADGRLQPRRWLRMALFPLELLAVAWSLPVAILLILAPIAAAFWLGRLLIAAF